MAIKLVAELKIALLASAYRGSTNLESISVAAVDMTSEATPALAILKKAWSRNRNAVGTIDAEKKNKATETNGITYCSSG